jgi:hypothetical protein
MTTRRMTPRVVSPLSAILLCVSLMLAVVSVRGDIGQYDHASPPTLAGLESIALSPKSTRSTVGASMQSELDRALHAVKQIQIEIMSRQAAAADVDEGALADELDQERGLLKKVATRHIAAHRAGTHEAAASALHRVCHLQLTCVRVWVGRVSERVDPVISAVRPSGYHRSVCDPAHTHACDVESRLTHVCAACVCTHVCGLSLSPQPTVSIFVIVIICCCSTRRRLHTARKASMV